MIEIDKKQKGVCYMLKLENVKKSYDGTTVLDGINLEIEDGEIVSILGHLDVERQPY